MANWRHKIELGDFYHDNSLSIQDKGRKVAERIRAELGRYDEALDIADQFEDIADVEEFDDCMETLYDFGDQHTHPGGWPPSRLCWIGTFAAQVIEDSTNR